MRAQYDVREVYTGDGVTTLYTYDFKIVNLSELLVLLVNTVTGAITWQVRGNVTTYFTAAINGENGGTLTLLAALPIGSKLIVLLADDTPKQPSKYVADDKYTMKKIESSLDTLSGQIQRMRYLLDRSIRLPEKITTSITTELPELIADSVITVNAAATALESTPKSAFKGDKGDTGSGANVTPYDGYSARFNEQFTATGLQDVLDKIIKITYTPPTIALTGSSNFLREKGTSVTSILLSALVTKKSDPIAAVRFYQGATLLGTKTGTIPTGGTETQAYSTPFSNDISFSAQVDDNGATGGPTTVTSNTTYSFVYPYYYGAGAVGLTAAQVSALTKDIIVSTATKTVTMTATAGQVFYFAYLASYGALTSILDVNGFETIGAWTLTTSNITGLDASAQSYRIYSFNNPVTAGAYQYTFKR